MVMPFEHLGRLQDVEPEITAEMIDLAQQAMRRMEEVYSPEGFNVGLNQGRVAGAGVDGHIHLHVVPRWAGVHNYMPLLADTRVMPQSLEETYDALEGGFT
jgi:ATP adenylyltransferase